jgi:hypothetical protein
MATESAASIATEMLANFMFPSWRVLRAGSGSRYSSSLTAASQRFI